MYGKITDISNIVLPDYLCPEITLIEILKKNQVVELELPSHFADFSMLP